MKKHDHDHQSKTSPCGDSTAENEHGLRAKAKKKAKHFFHLDSNPAEIGDDPYHAALDELENSPAFNSSKFLNRTRLGSSGSTGRAIDLVQGAAAAFINPKTALQNLATRKTAGSLAKSRPYLSRKADLDFLEAHDDLQRAEASRDGSGDGDDETAANNEEGVDQCEDRLEDLERTRQNMRVAWVTARHVQRVRVIHDVSPIFPENSFFEQEDDFGFTEFNWGKWIGYKLIHQSHNFSAQYIDDFEELPFDTDALRKHIERLIIVSAPLQTLLIETRRVYRWENPRRTATIMLIYFSLWHISHIMTFVYGYILYSTIMNYYYPRSVDDLRNEIARTIDRGATALKVGELMDKHGNDDWLGPLMAELGPFIQVQVADLASLLEASYNLYHFCSPRATFASLFLIGSVFLTSALTDSRFSLKLFWFILGTIFFVLWPVSSLYPRYRLLVSPLKIALWDVPNHPEWCFQYLQERAAAVREALAAHHSEDNYVQTGREDDTLLDSMDDGSGTDSFYSVRTTIDNHHDILSFGCTYLHVLGRLIISTHGMRFKCTIGKSLPHETFDKSYTDLVEMSKRQPRSSMLIPLAKLTKVMDKLELRFREGQSGAGAGMHRMGKPEHVDIMLLENMRGRDKAFNAIIAFSNVRWQHLQQRPSKPRPEEKQGDALPI